MTEPALFISLVTPLFLELWSVLGLTLAFALAYLVWEAKG